jgi:hypothetical protein
MQHLRHRLPEVAAAVVRGLVGVGRVAAAADLQEGMNDIAGTTAQLPATIEWSYCFVECGGSCTQAPDSLLLTEHHRCNTMLVALAGAIQTLCAGGLFDRARQLAGNSTQLLALIDEQHTQHLVASNDAEELANRGNAAAAVEMFAAQGNWKRAHELVRRTAAASSFAPLRCSYSQRRPEMSYECKVSDMISSCVVRRLHKLGRSCQQPTLHGMRCCC